MSKANLKAASATSTAISFISSGDEQFFITPINSSSKETQQKLEFFSRECIDHLVCCARNLFEKFAEIKRCVAYPEIRRGQKFLRITIEFVNAPACSRVVRGINAISDACEYIDTFKLPALDFESLASPHKLEQFKKEVVVPKLKRFRDYHDVETIEILTSERISPHFRRWMKWVFPQKSRLTVIITMGAGERIQTNVKILNTTTKTYLRQLIPMHSIYCDVLRLDKRLYPFPISSIFFKPIKSKKKRLQAVIRYTNGFEQTINYLANLGKSDLPDYILPEKLSVMHKSTHEFFYLWSAVERLPNKYQSRRIVYKFGITSATSSDSEFDLFLLKQAIRKRILSYAKSHSMDLQDIEIELISKPEPTKPTVRSLSSQFESLLKDPKSNRLLVDRSNQSTRTRATEIMIQGRHDIDVLQYTLALARDKLPLLRFFYRRSDEGD